MPDQDTTVATPMFGAAARAYLAAGWPSVLPLPHAAKTPPPSGYTGRQGAWPTPAQVDEWTATFPDGNLALRLPVDVIGIDVDAYAGKPGAATLAELEAELGPLPSTLLTTSRSDGISGIRLFRTPQRPTWHDPGPGVEIIHSGWRYVIVAPSIHDRTGDRYRWIDQRTGELVSGAPRPAALAELPTAWADHLSADTDHHKAEVTARQVADWIGDLTPGTPCTATRNALNQLHVDLTAGGARHDAMLDATGRIVRALERGHQGGPAALSEAQAAFIAAVTADGTRTPQQATLEWQRALDGAYALVAASPTPEHERGCRCTGPDLPATTILTVTDHNQNGNDGGSGLSPLEQLRADPDYQAMVAQEATRQIARDDARALVAAQQADLDPPPPLIDLPTFLATPDPDVTYRIDDVWPAGGRILLAAQYKAGKTTAVGNLLRALADQQPFLDRYDVHRPDGNIVLIDDELHENTLRRWLRDQQIGRPEQISLVPLRGRLSTFDILNPEVRAAWADQLRQVGAQVVILDCLRPIIDALGLSEDKDVGKVLTAFDELLEEAGADEAVIVHHMGHAGERSRGDSRLRDWPDAEWKLVRQKPDGEDDGVEDLTAKRFFSALGRDVLVEESELAYDDATRRLSIVGGSRRDSRLRGVVDAVVQAVHDEPGITVRGLREAVRGVVDARNEDIDRARDRAVLEHLIRVERGARNAHLHHPATTTVPTVPDRAPSVPGTVVSECAPVPIGGTGTHTQHAPPTSTTAPRGTHTPLPPGSREVPL